MKKSVRILHGALQPSERGNGAILRGMVHPEDLVNLMVDSAYQRIDLHELSVEQSFNDTTTQLPDLDLGMRGHRYRREGDTFELLDAVYLIDGLQRTSSAIRHLDAGGDVKLVELGATIHFDSNFLWEKRRFEILNRLRIATSSDLLVRNRKDDHPMVEMLYQLTLHDEALPIYRRVSWEQRRARDTLLGGYGLVKHMVRLHEDFLPRRSASNFEHVLRASDLLAHRLGVELLRENTMTFFLLLDDAWGLRNLEFARKSTVVKDGFLSCMCMLLGQYAEFWRPVDAEDHFNTKLFVDKRMRSKLKAWDIAEREIADLAGSGSAKSSRSILFGLLLHHINSGRREILQRREYFEWPDDGVTGTTPPPEAGEEGEEARP